MENWKSWKKWKKWIFQISIEKKHGNSKEHGLVHQLLRKYGSVEIMEDMEKVDFQISIEQKYHLFGKYGSFGVQCQGFDKC